MLNFAQRMSTHLNPAGFTSSNDISKFQTGFQAGAEKSGCIPKVLSAISAKVVSAKSNTGMMYVSFANSFSYIIKTSEN